jgi:hypothetical protein
VPEDFEDPGQIKDLAACLLSPSELNAVMETNADSAMHCVSGNTIACTGCDQRPDTRDGINAGGAGAVRLAARHDRDSGSTPAGGAGARSNESGSTD